MKKLIFCTVQKLMVRFRTKNDFHFDSNSRILKTRSYWNPYKSKFHEYVFWYWSNSQTQNSDSLLLEMRIYDCTKHCIKYIS